MVYRNMNGIANGKMNSASVLEWKEEVKSENANLGQRK